jgi:hypothetical protein
MPKPVKATKPAAQTNPPAQKEQPIKWPQLRPKKGLTLESILDDQIYIIDVSPFEVTMYRYAPAYLVLTFAHESHYYCGCSA